MWIENPKVPVNQPIQCAKIPDSDWPIEYQKKRQIDTKPKIISSVPPPSLPLNPVPSPSILKKSIPKPDPKPETNFGQGSYEIGSKYDTGFGSVEYVSPISFKPYKGIILKIIT